MDQTLTSSRLARVLQALTAPRDLGLAIRDGLGWKFPALLISLAVVFMDAASLPIFFKSLSQIVPVGIGPEKLAQVQRTSIVMAPIKILLKPIGIFMAWYLSAGLLFLLSMAANHRLRFKWLLSTVIWTSLVFLLEALLKNGITWVRYASTGSILLDPPIGLDALIPAGQPVLSALLAHANPFEFWFLYLLIPRLAAVGTVSTRVAAAIALPAWSLYVVAHVTYAIFKAILVSQLGP